MKQSKYNYIVKSDNKTIIYNGLKDSSIVVLNTEYVNLLKPIIEYPDNFKSKFPTIISKIKEKGFIIESNFNEVDHIYEENKKKINQNETYHLTINPTLECNFNCWYCSVHEAVSDTNKLSGKMSKKTMQSIIIHFENIIKSKEYKNVMIDWFGGEPLKYYWEIIKPISDSINICAIKNKVNFSQFITTNAYLLDANIINDIKTKKFSTFQITLDGVENRHNKIRNEKGKPSYSTIVNNISKINLLLPNTKIFLRINYDKTTLQNIGDLISWINNLNNKTSLLVDFQRVWQVIFDHEENQLLKKAINEFRKNDINVKEPKYRPNRYYSCYADISTYLVINYDGNLYKCAARDYEDDIKIGIVGDNGEFIFNEKFYEYSNISLKDLKQCKECKELPLCYGPCIQKVSEYNKKKVDFKSICLKSNTEINIETYIKNKVRL